MANGKFIYAIIFVMIIEVSLYVFGGTTYANSSLFSIIDNPSQIYTNPFYIAIGIAVAVFAGSQIIPGNLWNINVYGVYAGMAIPALTFFVSIIHLWTFAAAELTDVMGLGMAHLVVGITMIPIALFYLLAVAEWVRSN